MLWSAFRLPTWGQTCVHLVAFLIKRKIMSKSGITLQGHQGNPPTRKVMPYFFFLFVFTVQASRIPSCNLRLISLFYFQGGALP